MGRLEHLTRWSRDPEARIVNGWCAIPSPVTAELMARSGFQTVTLDLQHGLIDVQTALSMIQVIDALSVPSIVRVPWLDAGTIMKMLDFGATGIICPMINSATEAERLVEFCRYPPKGQRSFGPTRASIAFGSSYAKDANNAVTIMPMNMAMVSTRMTITRGTIMPKGTATCISGSTPKTPG